MCFLESDRETKVMENIVVSNFITLRTLFSCKYHIFQILIFPLCLPFVVTKKENATCKTIPELQSIHLCLVTS